MNTCQCTISLHSYIITSTNMYQGNNNMYTTSTSAVPRTSGVADGLGFFIRFFCDGNFGLTMY